MRPDWSVNFSAELLPLTERLTARIGNAVIAGRALKLVAEKAPDERLALAFLLKLAETSLDDLVSILSHPETAAGLVFCLGSSELVGAGICANQSPYEFFREAAAGALNSVIEESRLQLNQPIDRKTAGMMLGEFKTRLFLKIAIADLLGNLTVTQTMTAMSRLADECIRAALRAA
ncbi:MAG: hypothetical protein ACREP6_13195, partial [Candidatus Binataceae bacterium]